MRVKFKIGNSVNMHTTNIEFEYEADHLLTTETIEAMFLNAKRWYGILNSDLP